MAPHRSPPVAAFDRRAEFPPAYTTGSFSHTPAIWRPMGSPLVRMKAAVESPASTEWLAICPAAPRCLIARVADSDRAFSSGKARGPVTLAYWSQISPASWISAGGRRRAGPYSSSGIATDAISKTIPSCLRLAWLLTVDRLNCADLYYWPTMSPPKRFARSTGAASERPRTSEFG